MSPTAELLPPLLRLNDGGTVFKKGVPQPVSYDMARKLAASPRFKVTGLDTKEAVEAAALAARPKGEALLQAIRDAASDLDIDDDANFDRHGKPDHRALSDKLGFPVSAAERDRALGIGQRSASIGQLESADGRVEKKGGVNIKRAAAPAKAAPAPEPAVDPTTQGAIDG